MAKCEKCKLLSNTVLVFPKIVLSALYETYSDVKRLEKKKEEIRKETYEKQMRELRKSIAIEAKSTFRVLARNFVIWYGLTAFTFIITPPETMILEIAVVSIQ